MNAAPRLLYSIETLAEALSYSPATLRDWRKEGRIPGAIKLGEALRFDGEIIQAWIDQGCPTRLHWPTRWTRHE